MITIAEAGGGSPLKHSRICAPTQAHAHAPCTDRTTLELERRRFIYTNRILYPVNPDDIPSYMTTRIHRHPLNIGGGQSLLEPWSGQGRACHFR